MISVPASRNLAINQEENGYWRSEPAAAAIWVFNSYGKTVVKGELGFHARTA